MRDRTLEDWPFPVPAPRSLIDVHVHLAALPMPGNGVRVSPDYARSFVFKAIQRKQGMKGMSPEEANRFFVERLVGHLRTADTIDRGVVLAMDGVYDASGRLDETATRFLIPNDLVLALARDHSDRVLPGASVNPHRRDAIDELRRCAEAGAVLIKWLPNSQRIRPDAADLKPFYRALADLKMPLLSHTGHEFTITAHEQELGQPGLMRHALEEGVTVISAHGGSFGYPTAEPYVRTLEALVKRFANYYLDTSALATPNRAGMVVELVKRPALKERLLFGTDYPVPVWVLPFVTRLRPKTSYRLGNVRNPFDKSALIQAAVGLEPNSKGFHRLLAARLGRPYDTAEAKPPPPSCPPAANRVEPLVQEPPQ